ncbi:MAG TPA: energy-coupling factor ABC transporter permease [Gemmataceae bacterium]|nr:energy-coupling factor ABC transporter permease [Gemmataceae bacterium]
MIVGQIPMHPILAIHISEGYLTLPWLAGGFALAGLLAAFAMIRVRDEEIPRIALMTAAFFVASLIHVPIGPTSVHLLLNGLLGVVLGRRAVLAVLIGITLQFALFAHGGLTTIGVNTCTMGLPALGAAWQFPVLLRAARRPWVRSVMVAAAVAAWTLCVVYSLAVLVLARNTGLYNGTFWTAAVGALAVPFNPFVLVAVGLLGVGAAVLERRLRHPPEFTAGFLTGMAATLATLVLAGAVLLWGSTDDWHTTVLTVFVAHMPIAAVEGVVLGCAVAFLARVKPEMLPGLSGGELGRRLSPAAATPANGVVTNAAPTGVMSAAPKPASPAGVTLPPPALLLLAVLGVLWTATPAQAHRLEADYRVRPDGQVQVESWFSEGGNAPAGAKIQVFRANRDVLIDSAVDGNGIFVFAPQAAEDLRVVVSAGAGHRAEFVIPASALPKPPPTKPANPTGAAASPPEELLVSAASTWGLLDAPQVQGPLVAVSAHYPAGTLPQPPPTNPSAAAPSPAKPLIEHPFEVPYKEIAAGLGLLFGLAAFVLSLRNRRELQELKRAQRQSGLTGNPHPPGPSGDADGAHFSAGKTSSSGTSH